ALARREGLRPADLRSRRWFGRKGSRMSSAEVSDLIRVPAVDGERWRAVAPAGVLLLVRVEYTEGDPETYMMPFTVEPAEAGEAGSLAPLLATLATDGGDLRLVDAMGLPEFGRALLRTIAYRRRL